MNHVLSRLLIHKVIGALRNQHRILCQIVDERRRSRFVCEHIIVNLQLIQREENVIASAPLTFIHRNRNLSPEEVLLIETQRKIRALVSFEIALCAFRLLELIRIDDVILIDYIEVAIA